MQRARSGTDTTARVGLPPSASLEGDEIFVAPRPTRRRGGRRDRAALGRGGGPLPAFAARRTGPIPLRASARLDGEDEARRIEERRRFELDPEDHGADVPARPGPEWARTG
ncbi:MAG TPA: hypothetical protein VMB72_01505 [Acidimicrobiales bacterium]|nr:hypothetical protein [Acidimicrobiales bacterium]